MKKSKSVIQLLFFNEPVEDNIKNRNIRQTEILVDLREAILQVKWSSKLLIHFKILFLFRLQGILFNLIQK